MSGVMIWKNIQCSLQNFGYKNLLKKVAAIDTHVHWDNHISGFYFLKCSDKTSYPIFHDPRAGMMTKLPQKDKNKIEYNVR